MTTTPKTPAEFAEQWCKNQEICRTMYGIFPTLEKFFEVAMSQARAEALDQCIAGAEREMKYREHYEEHTAAIACKEVISYFRALKTKDGADS